MRQETVLVPGARDVEATLDAPAAGDAEADADACVVACPPHPRHGGHRGDPRLSAVSERLVEGSSGAARVAVLRFDYGAWDEGRGEREDARNAVRWAAERHDRVGLFGYSFGGAVAALAAASIEIELAAVSLLAPASALDAGLDATAALDDVRAPVQVVFGERDATVDWRPLVARARELDCAVVELPADHFFVGQSGAVARTVGDFLTAHLVG